MWVGQFAGACQRAVRDATLFEERVQQIQSEWRNRLGSVRANSAADLRSYPQTNAAIERLVSAGILVQVTVGRRNRAFEAPEIINAFTDLERQLASPDGDTRTSAPIRPVSPRRPRSTLGLQDKPK